MIKLTRLIRIMLLQENSLGRVRSKQNHQFRGKVDNIQRKFKCLIWLLQPLMRPPKTINLLWTYNLIERRARLLSQMKEVLLIRRWVLILKDYKLNIIKLNNKVQVHLTLSKDHLGLMIKRLNLITSQLRLYKLI